MVIGHTVEVPALTAPSAPPLLDPVSIGIVEFVWLLSGLGMRSLFERVLVANICVLTLSFMYLSKTTGHNNNKLRHRTLPQKMTWKAKGTRDHLNTETCSFHISYFSLLTLDVAGADLSTFCPSFTSQSRLDTGQTPNDPHDGILMFDDHKLGSRSRWWKACRHMLEGKVHGWWIAFTRCGKIKTTCTGLSDTLP